MDDFDLEAIIPDQPDAAAEEQPQVSMAERIKRKRELLTRYMIDPNSTPDDFNRIIEEYGDDVPYTVNEALDLIQNNVSVFPLLNEYMNNFDNFYKRNIGSYILKYAKEHNPLNVPFNKVNHYPFNPYYGQGVSNKEFSDVWKLLRTKYVTLKDSDKDITAQLYSFEQLKELAGYNGDQGKSKISDSVDLSAPTTKEELYRYWFNLSTLYNKSDDNVFGTIYQENLHDNLKDVRLLFVTTYPSEEDKGRCLFSGSCYSWLWECINLWQLPSTSYIGINICNSITNKYIGNCLQEIFNPILDVFDKRAVILPVDDHTLRAFGCSDYNTFFKYNKRVVSGAMLAQNANIIAEILNMQKLPSVKRINSFTTENVLNNLHNIQNNVIVDKIETTDVDTDKRMSEISISEIAPKEFQFSKKQYTLEEFENVLNGLEGYNISYISRSLLENKNGLDKNGKPYIVMRKGHDKRFYYIDPHILMAYSTLKDCKAEEPLDRLHVVGDVSTKDIYKRKRDIIEAEMERGNPNPYFYNIDFTNSVYIASHIRNRFNYQEGINQPRIVVLDFETELSALKAKPDSEVNEGKCRLISFFDFLDKKFYCAVLKDPKYHNDVDLSDIKEHDGYPVHLDVYTNEQELWHWFNYMIETLDPDIITGWNVENFDLTWAIVRARRTLGITLKSKYGPFELIKNRGASMSEYSVACDGIAIIDYQKLYRHCSPHKMESYKLEYICQYELKKGKRKMIVDDHDEMYFKHLREYFLYNLEDVERVFDLENVKNYIRFEYELCNVCNISWDDIYAKTRLIDGLVYNYAWDNHGTLLREKTHSKDINNNIKSILYNDLVRYFSETGVTSIDGGKISLVDYMNELKTSIETKTDDDGNDVESSEKGYEGAIVLAPQSGIYEVVADLDASQMYPRLMIRSNIFKDTLCGVIAIRNEEFAEKWLYNRDAFPNEILVKEHNKVDNRMVLMTKQEFGEYLKDKILTPFGTIYWKPSVKRSLISNILFNLIDNRNKYKGLMKETIGKMGAALETGAKETDSNIIQMRMMIDRYDNLQNVYKQVINSFYGVMGLMVYRLADIFSAASITASGRELTRMVSCFASRYLDAMICEKSPDVPFEDVPIDCKSLEGLEDIENRPNVLYGDTDSAFLWMGRVVDSIYGKNIDFDKKIDHAWDLIEKTSQYINKFVIRNILERKGIDFNDADCEYNYEYKKELVISKIIFTNAKKQYAYNLVIREGKRLNEISMKGMLVVKSDNSRFSRETANGIINYILKEYDPNNVKESNAALMKKYNDSVEEARKLIRNGDLSIGRPVSMTRDLRTYKNIQSSIRGMMIYDILFDHEFTAGSKGYQYDLKEINWENLGVTQAALKRRFKERYEKCEWYQNMMRTCTDDLLFKSITIPTDAERLDTDKFIIDEKGTITGAIKDKVKNILAVVGLTVLDDEDAAKARKKRISAPVDFDDIFGDGEDVTFSV